MDLVEFTKFNNPKLYKMENRDAIYKSLLTIT